MAGIALPILRARDRKVRDRVLIAPVATGNATIRRMDVSSA